MSRQASGLRAWLLQRITAIVIAGGFIIFTIKLLLLPPQNLFEWRIWLDTPLVSVMVMMWVIAILLHAWVGIRDIMVDYVKPSSVRFVLLTGLAFALTSMATWLLLIVISLVKV